jgi:hypothetical protein
MTQSLHSTESPAQPPSAPWWDVPKGTALSGIAAIVKLLLVFAPFATFAGCGVPRPAVTWSGFEAAQYAPLPFLVVAAGAGLAIVMFLLAHKRRLPAIRRAANWTAVTACLSLAALVYVAFTFLRDIDPYTVLRWGFWGMIVSDAAIVLGTLMDYYAEE